MNRSTRALALGLVASLFLSALPVPAAAALGKAAPALPVGAGAGLGVFGAAGAARLAPAALTLTAPGLSAGLSAPALAPGAPALSLAAAAPVAAASAVMPAAPASALAAPADAPARRTVIAGVETAFTRIQGAKDNGPAATGAALDELFEGFARRGAPADAPLASAARPAAPLAPASARTAAPADGPRWVLTEAKPDAPKSSWKRTFSVGFLGALLPLLATGVITGVAQLLGYEPHPNYASPAAGMSATPGVLEALVLALAASVLAPVAEEIVFRAGIQGGLAKVTRYLRLGSYYVSAVLGALIFVAVHETADPVLFGARLVTALAWAHIYHKEGMLASMAAHGFHNGLITVPILLAAFTGVLPLGELGMGVAQTLLAGGALAAIVYYAVKSYRYLKAQRPDVASGAVAPKAFTAGHGWLALFVMAAGYFLLMPNIFWLAAMIGLMPWLVYKHYKG